MDKTQHHKYIEIAWAWSTKSMPASKVEFDLTWKTAQQLSCLQNPQHKGNEVIAKGVNTAYDTSEAAHSLKFCESIAG